MASMDVFAVAWLNTMTISTLEGENTGYIYVEYTIMQ
jgi:hypothetical protein